MNVVVNNLLTHYEVKGSGEPIVLLHGWGDSLQGLKDLQAELADSFKVISLDLPGFGATEAPSATWNLDSYAEHVGAFLTKIDVTPFAILGHSNGGAIAIRGLANGSLKSDKLILLAAAGIRTNQSAKKLLFKVVAKGGKVATAALPKSTQLKLRRKLYGAAGSDLLVVEGMQETFKATVRQDVQADAAKLTLPTLLVFAENDLAVPLADGRRYKELIAGSKLEIIGGAGHFLHLEKPEKVLGLIRNFLK